LSRTLIHTQATPKHEDKKDVDQPMEVQATVDANKFPQSLAKGFKLNELPHVNPDNLEDLIQRLKEISRAETDVYVEMKQDNHNFLQADEEESDVKQDESKPTKEDNDEDLKTLEGLRIQRELMGILLPKNCNLEEICQDMDVNTEGIIWKDGIRFSGMLENAKPHQVIGKLPMSWIG
jgi:hypothetical protein